MTLVKCRRIPTMFVTVVVEARTVSQSNGLGSRHVRCSLVGRCTAFPPTKCNCKSGLGFLSRIPSHTTCPQAQRVRDSTNSTTRHLTCYRTRDYFSEHSINVRAGRDIAASSNPLSPVRVLFERTQQNFVRFSSTAGSALLTYGAA